MTLLAKHNTASNTQFDCWHCKHPGFWIPVLRMIYLRVIMLKYIFGYSAIMYSVPLHLCIRLLCNYVFGYSAGAGWIAHWLLLLQCIRLLCNYVFGYSAGAIHDLIMNWLLVCMVLPSLVDSYGNTLVLWMLGCLVAWMHGCLVASLLDS
jgi:hypothetical protein